MVKMRTHVLRLSYPEGGRAIRAVKRLIFLVNHPKRDDSSSTWLLHGSYVMMMVVVMMHHGELLLYGGRPSLTLLGQLLCRRMKGQSLHTLEVAWVRGHVRLPGLRKGPPTYLVVSGSANTINGGRRSI